MKQYYLIFVEYKKLLNSPNNTFTGPKQLCSYRSSCVGYMNVASPLHRIWGSMLHKDPKPQAAILMNNPAQVLGRQLMCFTHVRKRRWLLPNAVMVQGCPDTVPHRVNRLKLAESLKFAFQRTGSP